MHGPDPILFWRPKQGSIEGAKRQPPYIGHRTSVSTDQTDQRSPWNQARMDIFHEDEDE